MESVEASIEDELRALEIGALDPAEQLGSDLARQTFCLPRPKVVDFPR